MTHNLFDPSNRRTLVMVLSVVAFIVCCCTAGLVIAGVVIIGDSEGVCVVASPTGRPGWSHCYDGWTEQECDSLSDTTYHSTGSCNALGFTKQCPGEAPAWRLPSYPCD